jgi:hypothetical protein
MLIQNELRMQMPDKFLTLQDVTKGSQGKLGGKAGLSEILTFAVKFLPALAHSMTERD